MKGKKRTPVPVDLAARVMFEANRTCCVCRREGKPVQIHHIDDNPDNSIYDNLAVLCLDCHNATQLKGGFARKLDAEQIVLYRDDWIRAVARDRAEFAAVMASDIEDKTEIGIITTTAELLRERKQYVLLAIHYHRYGNPELRDKYVELALREDTDAQTEVFLRALQGKPELIRPESVREEIERKQKNEDWSQLARVYRDVGDYKNAIRYYFRAVVEDLDAGNPFPAAYYLKELCEEEFFRPLFQEAFAESSKEKDLWWQVRALQELGWETELRELLMQGRSEIEKSGNPLLQIELYKRFGETEKLKEAYKEFYSSVRRGRVGEPGDSGAETELKE